MVYEDIEALQHAKYTSEKQRYTKEHWLTRWIRSNMETHEHRIKRHEGFYQYCMDRYLVHVVAKQLGKEHPVGGFGMYPALHVHVQCLNGCRTATVLREALNHTSTTAITAATVN